jgi:2-desacetyl-2-hydroxyethyl bacteriochlorophyllide A dehydrogenase
LKIQRVVFPDKNMCEIEETEANDTPAPDEIQVRNSVTLVSAGTELTMFTRTHRGFDEPDFGYAKYPFYPGYCAVGEVTAIGEKVTEFKPGDRAVHSGGHATCQNINADRCILLPESVEDTYAAFFPLIKIAMTSPILAPVSKGENVVVIGAGIVGNLCAQLCRIDGAGCTAIADIAETRLETAKKTGIEKVFNLSEKPLTDWAEELGPGGAQLIVEAVGIAPTIDAALKAVADCGRVVLLGSPRSKMEIDPYFDIHRKAIHLIGAHGRGVPPETIKENTPYVLDLLGSRKLSIDPLITHTMPFTDALKAYEGLRDNKDEYMGVIFTY